MKYRKLLNQWKVKDAPASVKMTIDSHCPRKWAFVDMETGDIWTHKSRMRRSKKRDFYTFWRADHDALVMVKMAAEKQIDSDRIKDICDLAAHLQPPKP